METLFFLLVLIICCSFFLTWLIRNFSLKKQILDVPNERSSHFHPTPTGGGLAIVVAWYAGLIYLFMYGFIPGNLFFALMSGIIIAVVSLLDDVYDIKPIIRFSAQTVTAIISFSLLHGIHPVLFLGKNFLPEVVLYPIAIIGIVWFINLYNFLDGIDGYASLEAIAAGLAFYFITGDNINLILIAAVTGFLIWNWPRAKIFMGDVGSTQLGFIIIVLGIYFHNSDKLPIICWLILLAPFWFDATLTLFRRWRRNENLSKAHRNHIYQRLVQSGFSHLKVDLLLSAVNLILIFLVIIAIKSVELQVPFFITALVAMSLISMYADKRKPF
jgi:UDP-N-acetylmuramyl pentapeptide phosphotransferase/UDP-N-acetylglucosamine-1-phosphate transferase